MNTERMTPTRADPAPRQRLEDFGFGSTLVAMAAAAVLVAIAPVLDRAGAMTAWMDTCMTVAAAVWPAATAAIGLSG